MPLPMNLEPVVRHHLATGHRPPNPVDEDLAATTWQRPEPGTGQSLEHLAQWPLRDFRKVVDLRG